MSLFFFDFFFEKKFPEVLEESRKKLHANFHVPRKTFSDRIQIGHKRGFYYYLLFISSVNIKPPRHRFGFSLAWGWQYMSLCDRVGSYRRVARKEMVIKHI